MDWKRIMNKKKRQQVMTEEEITRYLTCLIPEWNLRLLTDTDISANVVLWVESVTVTAYQSAPEAKLFEKLNLWKRFARFLSAGADKKMSYGNAGHSRSLKK